MWVHAMDVYASVAKEVEPKKKLVAELNAQLDEANKNLKEKTDQLQEVLDRVAALQKACDEAMAEKQRLADEAALTQSRLERANKLTSGLADEGVRWKATLETLSADRLNLIGDAFLSCGAVSYYGPFTGEYRDELVAGWLEETVKNGVPAPGKASRWQKLFRIQLRSAIGRITPSQRIRCPPITVFSLLGSAGLLWWIHKAKQIAGSRRRMRKTIFK